MATTKEMLFSNVAPQKQASSNRVTVVGVGAVGMACAVGLLTQGVTTDLVLCDMMTEKMEGEMMDLQHGALFLHNAKISSSTDYEATAGSKICIVTAGVRQREGETRLDLVQRNTEVMKNIIPNLVKYSPDTVLIIVSNPCDILTYVAWKLSGLPKNKVISSGCNLDSSRFRFLLSQKLGVCPSSVHGYIIGEHGDSSVPVWSGVNVAGVCLRDMNPYIGMDQDPEKWNEIHKAVVNSAYNVIKLKGYTSWAIGLSVTDITKSILCNLNKVHPVGVMAQGFHGIEQQVYLSLPAVLGSNGVSKIVQQRLCEKEKEGLLKSVNVIYDVLKDIQF